MEQPKRYSKRVYVVAGVIAALLIIPCVVVVIQMAHPKPQPCERLYDTQGWLYDADGKSMVTLYTAAAGVTVAEIVPVYGVGQSLIVDVDQKCTYGEHVYYHVDLGDGTAGWVPSLYMEWSKPRP